METEPNQPVQNSEELPRRSVRRNFRNFGCGILLAAWFLFLLTPCLIVYLAVMGEIVMKHSDVPEDQFRIWTISSTTTRGIAVSNARRVDTSDGLSCTLTDAYFLLWQGKGGTSQHYCICYSHTDGEYSQILTGDAACQKAGN